MTTFKALRVHHGAGSYQAQFDTLQVEDLSAGEVVIRAAYSSLNFKDALAVTGKGKILRGSPRVPGIDVSGVVESSADPAFKVGDEVLVTGCNLGESLDGGLSQVVRVPASAVVKLPTPLSLLEAMIIGTAGFTAALALKRLLDNHQSPEHGPMLVTGATGGVGSIAIGLLKRQGFGVHALTGKPDSEAFLKALGADEVVDRTTLVMGSKPLEAATYGGAVDNLGGDTLNWLTRVVKPWGNIASIGLAQGHTLNTTVMPFILRGVSLLGIHSVECPRAWREELWQKLATDWKPRGLAELICTQVVGLESVPQVCEAIMAGKIQGRTVVKID
jgi:NADPH2:quinone reductase